MALIICKECRRQFSDLAQACPGCGAPTTYSLDASQPATPAIPPAAAAAPVFTVAAPELPVAEPAHLLSKPLAAPVAEPVVEPPAPSAYQFVVDHSATADSTYGSKPSRRQVGPLLVIGIFFLPWIFYWLLLRDGYGNLIRTLGFLWLLLCTAGGLALNYGLAERDPLPAVAEVPQSINPEQPKEDLSNPVFYPLAGQTGNVATADPAAAQQPASLNTNTVNGHTALDNGVDTAGSSPATQPADNTPAASIYASSDNSEALQQNLGSCLQHEADTGRYSLSDNGKSVAKMISVCYNDFKPWFDQCMLDKNNAKSCNLDAIDMTTNILQLTGH